MEDFRTWLWRKTLPETGDYATGESQALEVTGRQCVEVALQYGGPTTWLVLVFAATVNPTETEPLYGFGEDTRNRSSAADSEVIYLDQRLAAQVWDAVNRGSE